MAVSSDLGDSLDVHPKHKQPVGERLAHWALNQTYGKKNVTPSGPMFRNVEFRDGAAYVSFDCAEGCMHRTESRYRHSKWQKQRIFIIRPQPKS